MCHQNDVMDKLGHLLDLHQGTDTHETTQQSMATVLTLCSVLIANVTKCMLHDYGQKWKHTRAQFEVNRKFTRGHNPTDENMEAGPGIYDNYKHQVNTYDETSVYKRDCGQLVPKSADTPKTDCRDGRVVRSVKTKKQETLEEMTAVTGPPCPPGGCGGP